MTINILSRALKIFIPNNSNKTRKRDIFGFKATLKIAR
jgi:hypothetical protein